ncbi:MAG TPA: hypothetical protein VF665_00200 [Longimicrobium sp.]|jgi:hypothetical protein
MPFALPLPIEWKQSGWRVRIAEKERVEPPHVTIRRRERTWRLGLRDGRFLDRRPPPSEVPDTLLTIVTSAFPVLIEEWDRKYPHNPVSSGADDG